MHALPRPTKAGEGTSDDFPEVCDAPPGAKSAFG